MILRELQKKFIMVVSISYIVLLSIFDILDSEWIVQLIEDGSVKWKYPAIMSILKSITNLIGIIGIVFFGVKIDEHIELT